MQQKMSRDLQFINKEHISLNIKMITINKIFHTIGLLWELRDIQVNIIHHRFQS